MKHIYCTLISGLISISSYAQPEYIEMTHYLFPEFTQGVILMKSGIRNDALLNYNSLTEQMIFEKKTSLPNHMLSPQQDLGALSVFM